jgi:hypothetical protein
MSHRGSILGRAVEASVISVQLSALCVLSVRAQDELPKQLPKAGGGDSVISALSSM